MPYAISSPSRCEAFPHNCPYCEMAPASTMTQIPYSKMALSRIPGRVESRTWKVELPSCPSCAKWFSRSRVALFALGIAALLLPILIVFESTVTPILWCLALGGWIASLLWRRFRAQAFRIVYIGPNEIVYAARSEAYASEFATKNNLRYEHRSLVIRFA